MNRIDAVMMKYQLLVSFFEFALKHEGHYPGSIEDIKFSAKQIRATVDSILEELRGDYK